MRAYRVSAWYEKWVEISDDGDDPGSFCLSIIADGDTETSAAARMLIADIDVLIACLCEIKYGEDESD